ncbi:cytochrome P450 [Streptomyces sp. NPDC057116]|uniref:cytochrome P450 n=1 Tax=Streptomyces sp. NPDC057116 TaxID=3346023 RepID=UPI00362B017F
MLTSDHLTMTDEAVYAERGDYPYAEWDLLRREAPVFWYRPPQYEPFWVLTRHEDIAWVSRNPKIFSSAQRITLETPDAVEMFEAQIEQRAEMFGLTPDRPPALSYMDSPRHRHLRQVLAPCFTPKAIRDLEARFHELAAAYTADFVAILDEEGGADVARHLSGRLPVAAICELVGAPPADWDDIYAWALGATGAADPEYQRDGEDAEATFTRNMTALNTYVTELVQKRMAEIDGTGTDMLSRLVRARIEGEPLAFHEILFTIFNLLVAGIETTRNATTGGIRALLEHPEQLRKLSDDPSLMDGAVEEVLRWTTIAPHFVRTAKQDTEIRGQRIRKGECVVLWYPSANRDETVFDDPYRFDITRDAGAQIAFGGHGEHVCLGAHLARLELRAVLGAVLPHLPSLEMVRAPEFRVLHLQLAEFRRLVLRRKDG